MTSSELVATTGLARLGVPRNLPQLPGKLAAAWAARAEALVTYRQLLPGGYDANAVATSLLHLHYNRYRGIAKEHEAACMRLARSAALAWRAARRQERP